jgi:hypothetical protein
MNKVFVPEVQIFCKEMRFRLNKLSGANMFQRNLFVIEYKLRYKFKCNIILAKRNHVSVIVVAFVIILSEDWYYYYKIKLNICIYYF